MNNSGLFAQGQIKMSVEKAEHLYKTGNNDSAVAVLSEIISDTSSSDNDTLIAYACNLTGNILEDKGDFAKAYENYYRAMKIFYAAGAKNGLADAVNNVANMYYRKGLYEQALKYQTFALKLRTNLKDSTGIASSYNNIGNIFYSWGQYEKALKFYNKAIKIKTESGDTVEVINIRLNLGSAWLGLKNYETARFHYTEALRLATVGNNMVLEADGLINLGYAEFLDKNFSKALEMYDKALLISGRQNLEFEKMLALKNKGELFLELNNYTESEKYLDSAENLCSGLGIMESMMEILRFRIELNIRQGKYKEAWAIQEQYQKMNDELFNETTLQQLYDFQTIQEFDARQREMRIKDLEISLKTSQVNTMRLLLILTVALLILISVSLFMLFRMRLRKRELEAQRSQYAAMQKALSAQMNPHFISNSLSSIQNFFLNNDIPAASDYLNRFGKLIRKVLDLSMKEYITLDEELEMLRLYSQLEAVRLGKKIELKINIPDELSSNSIAIPPLLLQPVIENSIWHGISNHNEQGIITIDFEPGELFFNCIITDNGAGFEAAKSGLKPHKEKSYGLGLIRERIAMMSHGKNADETCFINEISDVKGAITGVKVKLTIPLRYV